MSAWALPEQLLYVGAFDDAAEVGAEKGERFETRVEGCLGFRSGSLAPHVSNRLCFLWLLRRVRSLRDVRRQACFGVNALAVGSRRVCWIGDRRMRPEHGERPAAVKLRGCAGPRPSRRPAFPPVATERGCCRGDQNGWSQSSGRSDRGGGSLTPGPAASQRAEFRVAVRKGAAAPALPALLPLPRARRRRGNSRPVRVGFRNSRQTCRVEVEEWA